MEDKDKIQTAPLNAGHIERSAVETQSHDILHLKRIINTASDVILQDISVEEESRSD